MDPTRLYQSLGDPTRLRILHLLRAGPLCVCHFQSILRAPQVKISKHLACLRQARLVQACRAGQWMIYRLADPLPPLLAANLQALHDLIDTGALPAFKRDLAARALALAATKSPVEKCC
jgi:ArsR family transcriptional regulator, arsenate/arsenite/antimonite-responsive transcriptional repressor